MSILTTLNLNSVEEIDPTRPIEIAGRTFSADATLEIVRLLNTQPAAYSLRIDLEAPACEFYWDVTHATFGAGEIFSFSSSPKGSLPTAIEIGIVRALYSLPTEDHEELLSGRRIVCLGSNEVIGSLVKIAGRMCSPTIGASALVGTGIQIAIDELLDKRLTETIFGCLHTYFRAAPLKYRFLELYRILEAKFLSDVKEKLDATFRQEPKGALDTALESLKSEMAQIVGLSQNHPSLFENLWDDLHSMKNTNSLAAALFRKLNNKSKIYSSPRPTAGAALIYMIRCAIVHAGEKDIIFEAFRDGDQALNAIMTNMEKATLATIGIII